MASPHLQYIPIGVHQRSSVAILGGAAFWDSDPDRAADAFGSAIAAGVNHLDVAPQYGRAQELLGPLIPAVRDRLWQPRPGAYYLTLEDVSGRRLDRVLFRVRAGW